MSPGKLASQAGHAFTEALKVTTPEYKDKREAYLEESPGTKVVLAAKDEQELRRIAFFCEQEGIPHALIVDSGHIMPPFFDGSEIVTALGIGPCYFDDVKHLTGHLNLVG